MSHRFAAIAVLFLVSGGCAEDPSGRSEQSGKAGAGDLDIAGVLLPGQSSAALAGSGSRPYRAFRFRGRAGEGFQVWAQAQTGEPVLFVITDDSRVLATGAAAGARTLYLRVQIPAALPPGLHDFYLVFATRAAKPAEMVVTLHRRPCQSASAAASSGPSICAHDHHFDSFVCDCVETVPCADASTCTLGRTCAAGQCAFRPL
jgi:hypothetical protein